MHKGSALLRSSGKFFDQFAETPSAIPDQFFSWKRADGPANLPAATPNFFQKHQNFFQQQPLENLHQRPPQSKQDFAFQQHTYWTQQLPPGAIPQNAYGQNFWPHQIQPNPMAQNPVAQNILAQPYLVSSASTKPYRKPKTLWEEFKRIYIEEVIAFTMSKSTLFTLIFSFMFLGCIFFLSGFFTAASVYKSQHSPVDQSKPHVPTETAMLQGRPDKPLNMRGRPGYDVPRSYQYQGGVQMDQNAHRPSQYAERQIAANNPNYR